MPLATGANLVPDEDHDDEIYRLDAGSLTRLVRPRGAQAFVDPEFPFDGGVTPHPRVLAALRGPVDRVFVIDAGGYVFEVRIDDVLATGEVADQIIGADLDGDGAEELVRAFDGDVVVGERTFAVDHAVSSLARGLVDGDGQDDVVVGGDRSITFLLSSRGWVPLAPVPAPEDPVTLVIDGTVVVGGARAPLRLLTLRPSVNAIPIEE